LAELLLRPLTIPLARLRLANERLQDALSS
jgi:hypothetical protein